MNFKGIIEHYSFVKLSNEERESFLIANKIFLKSKEPIIYEFDHSELYNHYSHEVSKIFAKPLITSVGELTINPVIIEQLNVLILEQCNNKFKSLLEKEEVIREQFYAYPPEKIEEIKIATMTSNGNSLYNKLYFELNKLRYKDFQSHINPILNFVKYDHKFIYDYLTGINNKSSFFENNYHSYILNNLYMSLLEEVNEYNSLISTEKGSRSKRIALMHELGMLDSDKFKSLSDPKKIKVIAYIMNEELVGDKKTNFRKNLTSLKPKSTMDPKGMASIHMHTILKEVLNS